MAKTVLFVHGTGVRKAAYEYSAALIVKQLHTIAPGVEFQPCRWGERHGARLQLGGASIPRFAVQAPAAPTEVQTSALWHLLARDPFFELRELSAPQVRELATPAVKESRKALSLQFGALEHSQAVFALVEDRVQAADWREAVRSVRDADAFGAVLAAAPVIDTTLLLALGRALVAFLQQRLADAYLPPLPRDLRDQLVDACVEWLGGRGLGAVSDWFSSKLVGLGIRWASAKARRERDALFSASFPVAGDIMLYQARGAGIRDFIARRVAECGSDVVLLAHSLGGIACVDLLLERPMPQVKLLVTVGSQAPFLYEIGALSGLPFDDPWPAHFTAPWLNFFDCSDLLSFAAEKVFGGHVRDHEIASDETIRDAHGAYWDAELLWKTLAPYLGQESR